MHVKVKLDSQNRLATHIRCVDILYLYIHFITAFIDKIPIVQREYKILSCGITFSTADALQIKMIILILNIVSKYDHWQIDIKIILTIFDKRTQRNKLINWLKNHIRYKSDH